MSEPRYARRPRSPTPLFAVLLIALGGCGREPPESHAATPPAVDVAHPVAREITEWDEYTGRLAAVETVEVRPRVSGYLESIHFKEGQIVIKGDLLFVIDPRPFRAALAVAEAEVTRAQTRLELARNDAERASRLVKSRAISAEEFDTRSKGAQEAVATLSGARAQVEAARLNLEFTEVRSPIEGRISSHFVTVGNLISGGSDDSTLLTTIVSLDPIHCYIDVDEQAYLRYVRLDREGTRPSSRDTPNPVWIALADEAEFKHEGHVDFVDNRIDPLSGTIRGRGVFTNPDQVLIPGMFVRVRLIGRPHQRTLLLPDAAIGIDQSIRVVLIVGQNNIVEQRTVTLGQFVDGLRVVRSGLTGEEDVIVNGIQRARPGSAVTPQRVTLGATVPAARADDGPP